MKDVSVVITVLDEQDNVGILAEKLRTALSQFSYEVIWVDDGSTDDTALNIRKSSDEHTRLISLTRNFGQTAALSAGIDLAEGDKFVGFSTGDGIRKMHLDL